MSFADKTEKSQFETLWFEFELPHSPQKVWRALTDPDLLAAWLLPVTGLELEPGVAFTFKTEPIGGWDGVVHCRILESHPHERLSYAWVVGDMDTVVTFTLRAAPAGTHLTLVHAGFKPDQTRNFGGARYGWRMMGEKLGELLGGLP